MKYKKQLTGIIVVVLCTIFIIICLPRKKEDTVILDDSISRAYYQFEMNGELFTLGETVDAFEKKGYMLKENYFSNSNKLVSDAISTHHFAKEDKDMFYGIIHCNLKEDCNYSNSRVIKLNFYRDANVILNHHITYETKYDDVVEALGKEDGYFYTDKSLKVWSISKEGKVDTPYFLLKFSGEKIVEIRIGLWWYEGEFEYSIEK